MNKNLWQKRFRLVKILNRKKKKHNSPIQNSTIKQDLYIRTFKYMLVEIWSFSVNYFVYSPISSVNP